MQIPMELTEESRELLMRHFKERTPLHDVLESATRKEMAGVAVYAFELTGEQATELLEMARGHCAPAVKDIEHAIFAARPVRSTWRSAMLRPFSVFVLV